MAITARKIIESALKKANILGVGENLSAEDASDALFELNAMIDSWSVEGGLIYNETIETFPLDGSVSYTIGNGADFDTDKPYEISAVTVTNGTTDYNLEDYDQEQYANISNKDSSGTPTNYYYNNNFPLATIFMYPRPSNVSTITIYSFKPLTTFADLSTSVSIPKGYEGAIVYNLAVRLAPNYGKEVAVSVSDIAKQYKGTIFASNERNENNVSYVDSALVSSTQFDINRG